MDNENQLVTEDTDLQGVIIALMKHRINWGTNKSEWPVCIKNAKGKDNVLGIARVTMKGSGVKRVGIVLDADTDLTSTWTKVKDFCGNNGGQPPPVCPPDGLILPIGEIKFGAWIMPDNQMEGMVEDFCHALVPDGSKNLWDFANECMRIAKSEFSAPFPNHYMPKAHIHTWLAWQATPGERMGEAITRKSLRTTSPKADSFATWFATLFDLDINRLPVTPRMS